MLPLVAEFNVKLLEADFNVVSPINHPAILPPPFATK